MGLYFRVLPKETMCFKDKKQFGNKKSKKLLTVLHVFAADINGSKRKLLVVGKSAKPRCFKRIRTLAVLYQSNSNSGMTLNSFSRVVKMF